MMLGNNGLRFLFGLLMILAFALKAEARRLNIAIPGLSQLGPFAVAKENGYYQEEGLEVEFIWMRAGVATQALVAGNVEFATLGGTAIAMALRGFPLRIVFTSFKAFMASLYTRPEIHSVRELKGKKVGVASIGTASDVLLREVLKRHGLEGGRDVVILAIGVSPTRYAALQKGIIDATLLTPPLNFDADQHGFRELINFAREDLVETQGNLVVAKNPSVRPRVGGEGDPRHHQRLLVYPKEP